MRKKIVTMLLCGSMIMTPNTVFYAETLGDGTEVESVGEVLNPGELSSGEETADRQNFLPEEDTFEEKTEESANPAELSENPEELNSGRTSELLQELLGDGESEEVLQMVPRVGAKQTEDASGECGNNLTWTFHGGALQISGKGAMWDYTLQEGEIDEDGRWITTSDSPFANLNITSVVIEEGVTHIGDGAFFDGSAIRSISLPSTLGSIGDGAFLFCSGITSISLPGGVSSIGEYAFSGCSRLTSCALPSGLEAVEYALFEDCTALKSVTIPSTVTSIGDWAFVGCASLTSVTIPESVGGIGAYAFSDCSSLTGLRLPFGVKELEEGTFAGCVKLSSISLPSGLTKIGSGAFAECEALKSISIPSSVQEISDYVFLGCSGLTKVTLPMSLTSLGATVFLDCSSLTELVFTGEAPAISSEAFAGETTSGATIAPLKVTAYYPCDKASWTSSVLKNYGGSITWLKNHQWNEGVVTVPASGDVPALKTYTCEVCGDTKRDIRPVPMYRLYNPNTGEHLYTSSQEEREKNIRAGWNDEKIAWYASGDDIGTIIWRLFNKAEDQHHYTMDLHEIDVLTKERGWVLEGPAWRSYPGEDVPIYRLFNSKLNPQASHHFTADEHEKNVLSAGDWQYEGIAWYGIDIRKYSN